MQETEIYEWLELFVRGAGLGIFGELGVQLWDLYRAKQEVNSVDRNLVGELILKINGLVGRGVAEESVGGRSGERWSMA